MTSVLAETHVLVEANGFDEAHVLVGATGSGKDAWTGSAERLTLDLAARDRRMSGWHRTTRPVVGRLLRHSSLPPLLLVLPPGPVRLRPQSEP